VKTDLSNNYLDEIFNALATNTSVEYLQLSISKISLNLKDPNSLRFIEKNSTLKTLNFSMLIFTISEMNILNETLMKNKSIKTLDLSGSNFTGPFEFLENENLKEFIFQPIWKNLDQKADEFHEKLKSNHSLTHLDLSMGMFDFMEIKNQMKDLNEVLENHPSIKSLVMKYIKEINIKQLLKNPIFEELTFQGRKNILISLDDIVTGLNSNRTLKCLNITNSTIISSLNLDSLKITNKSLQKIQMTGNQFDFSKNFNLFKELLNIPSLEEFYVRFNKIGRVGVEYLCDFLKFNSTLLKLEFNGKKKTFHF
jgi:hypothetical protein